MGNLVKVAGLLIELEKFINSPEGQALLVDAKKLVLDVETAAHSFATSAAPAPVVAAPAASA